MWKATLTSAYPEQGSKDFSDNRKGQIDGIRIQTARNSENEYLLVNKTCLHI
jgi:hypothetical protein